MKGSPTFKPYAYLALAWLAFAAYVWLSSARLPELVATHFGVNGVPNDYQTHSGYIQFTLIMGALVPAFVLGIFALIRFSDSSLMNIPHKEYWLAPERRRETFDFVQRRSAWLAGLFLAFFAGVHYFILAANGQTPARLPDAFIFWIGGGVVVLAILWIVAFIHHFFRRPA
jgi:serine/threonine-protein kinase